MLEDLVEHVGVPCRVLLRLLHGSDEVSEGECGCGGSVSLHVGDTDDVDPGLVVDRLDGGVHGGSGGGDSDDRVGDPGCGHRVVIVEAGVGCVPDGVLELVLEDVVHLADHLDLGVVETDGNGGLLRPVKDVHLVDGPGDGRVVFSAIHIVDDGSFLTGDELLDILDVLLVDFSVVIRIGELGLLDISCDHLLESFDIRFVDDAVLVGVAVDQEGSSVILEALLLLRFGCHPHGDSGDDNDDDCQNGD